MAIQKLASTSSFQIEIENGTDSNGNPVYRKKTFSNVKTDADLQNIFDVASAIKDVIDAGTRNVLLAESSKLVSAE